MNSQTPKISLPWPAIRSILFWGIVLGVAAGLFNFARTFTICWRVTQLSGIPPASCAGEAIKPLATPVIGVTKERLAATPTPELPASEDIEYPIWDGASRINILFVGFRGGDPITEACPFCTDTLILITVDPVTKTAGMLSIPRDLWVNIPGFGYSRINTAWTLGRGSKLPGGGPGLTMKTVSQFISVPVDYYVQVDFDTFVDIIDLLGGVDVYNNENIVLDPMSHGQDFGKVRITCCGMRHLNGTVALAYSRCRHIEQGCKDGDIGRAKRQQKVIFGIRDQVLSPENFPKLMAQAPQLYSVFSAGIHTNLSLDDAIKLAVLARDIPKENIKSKVIDTVIGDSVMLNNLQASIYRPIPDKVRILRDEVFTASGPIGPKATGHPIPLMLADQASIRILNGTSTANLDKRTGNYLTEKGMLVTEFGSTKLQSLTTIVLYSPKLYAFRFLLNTFDITRSAQIFIKSDPSQTVDIEIRLGKDWISKLPPDY